MSDLTWTPDTARLDSLELWERNPKRMSKARAERLLKSWRDLGQYQTLAVGPSGECYDGHQRIKALRAAGYAGNYEVAVRRASRPLTDRERERVIIESTVGAVGDLNWDELAAWDTEGLAEWGLDAEALATWNNDAANLALMLEADQEAATTGDTSEQTRQTLAERFGVPPFSVLDARQGYWQKRKAAWIALGIQSELGRGENLQNLSEANEEYRYNKAEYLARIGRGPKARTLGAIAPNEGGENGILASPGKYGKRGGVRMALHNDPMQRKHKYDDEAQA